MSIDTANKRRSALNTIPLIVYPTAEGTIGSNDRQQVTWLYVGNVAATPLALTTPANRVLIYTRTPRTIIEYAEMRVESFHAQRRNIIMDGTARVVNFHAQRRTIQ